MAPPIKVAYASCEIDFFGVWLTVSVLSKFTKHDTEIFTNSSCFNTNYYCHLNFSVVRNKEWDVSKGWGKSVDERLRSSSFYG